MAKVLVIGVSRGIGLETVKAALDAGHNVRALARSAASIAIRLSTMRYGACAYQGCAYRG